ncbi:hypothetical protein SDC9_11694 [bioreactor metagenome]|uniref:HNH nuclease domain-containing protein n=1 Tax=bioreactor metagenome TaxID=1076179 RepID=A0A644TGF1_9ZZZZ
MPYKPARPCKYPMCPGLTHDPSGYCDDHALLRTQARKPDIRRSASHRGYGDGWRKIRERVLVTTGIPSERWPEYDIDHMPRYNPAIEPDHEKYTLIPRLRGEHSRKTIKEDGGYGRKKSY